MGVALQYSHRLRMRCCNTLLSDPSRIDALFIQRLEPLTDFWFQLGVLCFGRGLVGYPMTRWLKEQIIPTCRLQILESQVELNLAKRKCEDLDNYATKGPHITDLGRLVCPRSLGVP